MVFRNAQYCWKLYYFADITLWNVSVWRMLLLLFLAKYLIIDLLGIKLSVVLCVGLLLCCSDETLGTWHHPVYTWTKPLGFSQGNVSSACLLHLCDRYTLFVGGGCVWLQCSCMVVIHAEPGFHIWSLCSSRYAFLGMQCLMCEMCVDIVLLMQILWQRICFE